MIVCDCFPILPHLWYLVLIFALICFGLGWFANALMTEVRTTNKEHQFISELAYEQSLMREVIHELATALSQVEVRECHYPANERRTNGTAEESNSL